MIATLTAAASFVFAAEEGGGGGEHKFEAHNWWLPETKEIIWGGAAILIVAFLLYRFALPAMKKGLADRTERIRGEIDAAATARADAEAALADARAKVAGADAEAAQIVADARRDAEALRADMTRRTAEMVTELDTAADADLGVSRQRVMSDLQGSAASLSFAATERLVVANLDDATQQALIEDFIAKVGAN